MYVLCSFQYIRVSASCTVTPSCPKCWTSWVSICPTNCQVRKSNASAHVLLPFSDFFRTPCVHCRSSKHRGKLVGGWREEGQAPGRPGWRGRRSGGAAEQPPERLNAVTVRRARCDGGCRYKHTRISVFRFLFEGITGRTLAVSVIKVYGFLFEVFSFNACIMYLIKKQPARIKYPSCCRSRKKTLPNSLKVKIYVTVCVNTNSSRHDVFTI